MNANYGEHAGCSECKFWLAPVKSDCGQCVNLQTGTYADNWCVRFERRGPKLDVGLSACQPLNGQ